MSDCGLRTRRRTLTLGMFVATAVALMLTDARCTDSLGHLSYVGGDTAATVMAPYLGVWNSEPNHGPVCKAADYGSGRFDSLLKVEASTVLFFEVECSIERFATTRQATSAVRLMCEGDGLRWRSDELWHHSNIKGDRVLIRAIQHRYDLKDDSGVELPDEWDMQIVTYLACE